MININKEEVIYLNNTTQDDVGRVFSYRGKILRGIYKEKADFVRGLFNSGFIDELIQKGLFVESKISEYSYDDYEFVVEHKKIHPIISPHKWTFSMLKDSALLVLNIARICKKYNYNMKDCHYLNVLIDSNKPIFIDLGSFIQGSNNFFIWRPYKEFLQCYLYPLKLWSFGLTSLSKNFISYNSKIEHSEYMLVRFRFFRILKPNLINKIAKIKFLFFDFLKMDLKIDYNKVNFKVNNQFIFNLIINLKKIINKFTFLEYFYRIKKIERKISRIKRSVNASLWCNYYSKGNKEKTNHRFDQISSLVSQYCPDIKTSFDFGGNNGRFSNFIFNNLKLKKSFCQDIDEEAIDFGYTNNRGSNKLIFLNFNAFSNKDNIFNYNHSGFKSDIVFALALTHHLVLAQFFDINYIFNIFFNYSNKYVCIEFMPKGLWIPGTEVNIPSWYNIDWFRNNFKKYFNILIEKQLEENRIIFVGYKKEK